MFSCLQILEAFLWFVLITLLNVTLIILTLSVSRLLNLFFFSSRRLHTRSLRDWSSDVCSSDLQRWAHRVQDRREGNPGREPPHRHRSEEHTSELQSRRDLVCRLLLEKKKKK